MIGVDSHKATHTAVAVDEVGRQIAVKTVRANTAGHLQLLQWAVQLGGGFEFALEDCRALTRRLEGDLLRAGQTVVRVQTRLMAGPGGCRGNPASPTRLMRPRSRSLLCVTRTCRERGWTARPAR